MKKNRAILKSFDELPRTAIAGARIDASHDRSRESASKPPCPATPSGRMPIQPSSPSHEEQSHAAPSRRKPAVMIVDDSSAIRSSLAKLLSDSGHLVLEAANGKHALELLSIGQVDLVLLDLYMPVKDGWDTFEAIASLPYPPAILMMTGHGFLHNWAEPGPRGILIEKPIDVPLLLEHLEDVLAEPPETRKERLTMQRRFARHTRPCRADRLHPVEEP